MMRRQTFIGKLLFFSGKPAGIFSHMKNIPGDGIEKIYRAMTRSEYKPRM